MVCVCECMVCAFKASGHMREACSQGAVGESKSRKQQAGRNGGACIICGWIGISEQQAPVFGISVSQSKKRCRESTVATAH